MKSITIVANWKSHKNVQQAQMWLTRFAEEKNNIPSHVSIFFCPGFHHLELASKYLPWVTLGVQNISPFPEGGYTGEIAATQVSDIASFSLIGHSERRKYFGETDEIVVQKIKLCLAAGMKPIVCVETQRHVSYVQEAITNFRTVGMFLYEPLSAISKDGVGQPQDIQEATKRVKELSVLCNQTPFLYGGSIKSENVAQFFQEEIFTGVGVGSASLDAEEFIQIIRVAKSVSP